MSEKTAIAWADSTGNPWVGCTKVSPGCKHCYAAELDANKFSRTMGGATKENPISHWGKGAPRVRTKAFWKDAVKWNAEAGDFGLKCPSCYELFVDYEMPGIAAVEKCQDCDEKLIANRPRIFPSLCDWLDDEVPIEWLADFLKLIHDTPNLDWLLLTKRPENWRGRIEEAITLWEDAPECADEMTIFLEGWTDCLDMPERGAWPENIWIGVSVENQAMADLRIPQLLHIPAKVRFLSVEPLLSEVKLDRVGTNEEFNCLTGKQGWLTICGHVDWVIVGGESGKGRRDCGVEAIVDVANQCVAARVPCFVKQDSAFKPGQQGRIPAETWALKQFPK